MIDGNTSALNTYMQRIDLEDAREAHIESLAAEISADLLDGLDVPLGTRLTASGYVSDDASFGDFMAEGSVDELVRRYLAKEIDADTLRRDALDSLNKYAARAAEKRAEYLEG